MRNKQIHSLILRCFSIDGGSTEEERKNSGVSCKESLMFLGGKIKRRRNGAFDKIIFSSYYIVIFNCKCFRIITCFLYEMVESTLSSPLVFPLFL